MFFVRSEDLMANTTLTNEMKSRTVIVSVKAKHARSFVCKVKKEMLNENNGDELATTRKRKSIVNALLTHSEYLSSSEECMAWHDG
ncbi:hypothetical protein ACTXT7_006864 [Hymenolepis weldensis]